MNKQHALIIVIKKNFIEISPLLLNIRGIQTTYKAHPNEQAYDRGTPFSHIINGCNPEIVHLVLKTGTINESFDERKALFFAVGQGYINIIRVLLEAHVNPIYVIKM